MSGTHQSTQTTQVTRPEILKINWTIEPVGWLSGLHVRKMKKQFHKMSTKELKEILEGAGVGSNNWHRASTELSSRMDAKAKASLVISFLAVLVAALSWLFPRTANEPKEKTTTVELKEIESSRTIN